MTRTDVEYAYLRKMIHYQSLADRVGRFLISVMSECSNRYPYEDIRYRVKDIKSFADKSQQRERGRRKYPNPIRDIHDVVGARIILYYEDHVRAVADLVSSHFNAKGIDDKSDSLRVKRWFGYQSIHLDCTISDEQAKSPDWKAFAKDHFEIQVRTLSQHLWAALSHRLSYKPHGKNGLTEDEQRYLETIAAQLEGLDRSFIALRDAH